MSEGTMTPGYLSIQSAAKWADISESTLKRWISKHGLRTYQGTERGKVLIRPSDIDAFMVRFRRQERPVVAAGAAREILTSLGYNCG